MPHTGNLAFISLYLFLVSEASFTRAHEKLSSATCWLQQWHTARSLTNGPLLYPVPSFGLMYIIDLYGTCMDTFAQHVLDAVLFTFFL